jgi:predicted kinase
MRKWMRERLKRRKQQSTPEKSSQEPAQEPLRPAYFESEEPERAGEPQASDGPEQAEPEVSATSTDETPTSAPGGPEGQGDRPRRRRRRGRGGRGRSSTQPQAPLQPTLMRDKEAAAAEPRKPVQTPEAGTAVSTPEKPKGIVVLAIGLPGSGKSSWFKRHKIRPLSSDLLREILFDDPTEQRFQDLVFSNLRSMLKARLIARRPLNYVDATNLSPHERHTWIKMAHDYGYEVQAVFFDVPLDVCLERNQRRKRNVANEVMHRMAGKLRAPKFEEGFSKITVVRVKKKDDGSEPLIAD